MDDSFKDISTIIHRDSKFNTYKFALLRATIESINQYDHLISISPYNVTLPMGIQIIKWLEYYYPFFASNTFIAQQRGDSTKRSLAFRKLYSKVIEYYKTHFGNGFEPILNSLKEGRISEEIKPDFIALIKKLKDTIVKNPMYYIGSSVNQGGEIYKYNKDAELNELQNTFSLNDVVKHSGTYSIPKHYHDVFKLMGSYILGMDSLIFGWAEFTVGVNKGDLSKEEAFSLVYNPIIQTRNVNEIKTFYSKLLNEETLYCAWSGNKINNDLNIDHILPFSFYQNNDVWNLIPTKAKVNNIKSDKIPTTILLDKRKSIILDYWVKAENAFKNRFNSEISIALLGLHSHEAFDWKEIAFQNLKNKCNFLINDQGFEPFEPKS